MNIKPIKTEADYRHALKRIDSLMDAKFGTPQGDELDILTILIEKYEEDKFPIRAPDPISAIKFRMEQLGMDQTDFAKIVGANRASEILSGRRSISISLIKTIHIELGIPYESLLDEEPQIKRSASR
jgi:HTH-type transcriptional regulator/antitoxin HigA